MSRPLSPRPRLSLAELSRVHARVRKRPWDTRGRAHSYAVVPADRIAAKRPNPKGDPMTTEPPAFDNATHAQIATAQAQAAAINDAAADIALAVSYGLSKLAEDGGEIVGVTIANQIEAAGQAIAAALDRLAVEVGALAADYQRATERR